MPFLHVLAQTEQCAKEVYTTLRILKVKMNKYILKPSWSSYDTYEDRVWKIVDSTVYSWTANWWVIETFSPPAMLKIHLVHQVYLKLDLRSNCDWLFLLTANCMTDVSNGEKQNSLLLFPRFPCNCSNRLSLMRCTHIIIWLLFVGVKIPSDLF